MTDIQQTARIALERDLAGGRPAHAYLFAGPGAASTLGAAVWFSQQLLCGCGTCEECRAVSNLRHPDVDLVQPAGNQLLVGQVRDAVASAWRTPSRAARKVLIVNGADRMNPNAQNAFLKALEEPPAFLTIILIATATEQILDTVKSRCRLVSFGVPGSDDGIASLVAQGADPAAATRFWNIGSSAEHAHDLCQHPEKYARVRELVLESTASLLGAIRLADHLAERAKLASDAVESEPVDDQFVKIPKAEAATRDRQLKRRASTDELFRAVDEAGVVLRDMVAAHAGAGLLDPAAPAPAASVAAMDSLADLAELKRRIQSNANTNLQLEWFATRLCRNFLTSSSKHR